MTKPILIETADGMLELEVFWQNNNPNDANTNTIALLCHPNPLHGGTMNNKVVTTMWRFARDAGYHVVRFNFRGVGQSTGTHDYAVGEIEDAMMVLQWVYEQTSANKLWLGGFSFGGYVAARVAELISQSAHIWDLANLQLHQVALIAPSVVNNDTSDLTLPAAKCFMIYGAADEIVDPHAMQAFAERMDIPSTAIADVGHFFHGKLTTLKQLLEVHLT